MATAAQAAPAAPAHLVGVGVEVDELHVDHHYDDPATFTDQHLQDPQHQQQHQQQSDSMRNLLIVESAGRSRLFVVEAVITLMLAACLLLLSLATVVFVPLMYSDAADERYPISVGLHNCGAYGLWLPFLAVACGTLMLKACHTGVPRYFSMFYGLCALTFLCCGTVVILRSLYYANGWYRPLLLPSASLHNRRQFSIQVACDSVCLALLLDTGALLAVYLRLFYRHVCDASGARFRRDSADDRNMFV